MIIILDYKEGTIIKSYLIQQSMSVFTKKQLKKLRKIAGGDVYTIIYLKLRLFTLKTNGIIEYESKGNSFFEELAVALSQIIDEDPINIEITLSFLLNNELMIENNTNISTMKVPAVKEKSDINKKKELLEDFEELWKLYPLGRKQGKKVALAAYLKALKEGVRHETILKGLISFNYYIEETKTQTEYIKLASTWFNQRCWEDDYTIGIRTKRKEDMSVGEYAMERVKKAMKEGTSNEQTGSRTGIISSIDWIRQENR